MLPQTHSSGTYYRRTRFFKKFGLQTFSIKSGALLNIVCQQATKFTNIFSGIQFSNSMVTSNIITTKKEEDK